MAAARGHDWDFIYKLVIIGDPGVGKSSILLQFAVRAKPGKTVFLTVSSLAIVLASTLSQRPRVHVQDGVFSKDIGATLGVDFVSKVLLLPHIVMCRKQLLFLDPDRWLASLRFDSRRICRGTEPSTSMASQ